MKNGKRSTIYRKNRINMSIFLHAPFQIYLRTVCYPYCRLIKALTSSCISLPDAKTELFLWNSILNVSSSYSMHQWTSFLISFLLHFQECYIQVCISMVLLFCFATYSLMPAIWEQRKQFHQLWQTSWKYSSSVHKKTSSNGPRCR